MKSKVTLHCIIIALAIVTVASCKKTINLDLGNVSGQLVIEGNITNVPGPQYVRLSRNVPFTNQNIYPPVTGANVTITDGNGHNYQLAEDSAGIYSIGTAQGIPGSDYMLTVTTGGQTYTAKSTMPATVVLDSLTDKDDYFNTGNNQKIVTVHFQDPPGTANQYRFVMYVNKVQVKSVFAFDDEFINGKHVDLDLQQNDIKIHPKDTVMVEFQCIDKPVYTYWYTLSQQQANNPGGQVAPANPPTNITPTTLGYFSAHTTQTITLVVK